MMEFAALWMVALVGIYLLVYLLNKRTPVPPGCENLDQSCGGCHLITCTRNPIHHEKEESHL